ncbi:hypothetical protein BLNAU_14122 [Blattamonas nauphoetae]|uniref:Uncharacterized protein n=1 Tax=Blattamonas nauphoetae TaxID=2049346 RepID=A0ABQ9XEN7_9EUKA|nr:hypothetical protein BLNAU_14122 [Blattamonas nauphoetae]
MPLYLLPLLLLSSHSTNDELIWQSLSSVLSEQSSQRNSKSGATVQEVRLAGNRYHSRLCLLSSATMDIIGEGARMSHTWSVWPEQNTESQTPDTASTDMVDTSKFMLVISNSTIGMSSVSLDSGWAGTSIAKIWSSSLSIGSSAIVSNWECSPFVVMCCSLEEGSSLSFFDISHTSSDKWTLLPLATLSSSPHSTNITPPCSRVRMDVSLSCSGLSIDDTCLVSESGPLFCSSPSQTGSPICLVSTALSSARLRNVTHSPSLHQSDQSVVSLSSQLLIGCRVMNSSNFLSGTVCRDFNEGGNLLAANTSFTSCTIDEPPRISKHFTTLQEISANTHTFQLCTFKGCTSTTNPGAAISILSPLSLILRQCSFDSCEAETGAGSAVFLETSVPTPVTLVVTSSSFVDGKSFIGSGGTFHLLHPQSFSLSDSVFLRSSSIGRGGVLFLSSTTPGSTTASISNCLFKECRSNITTSSSIHGGGAIHFHNGPAITLNSLFFRDNFAVSENGHDIYFNASIPSLTAQTMSNCFSTTTPAGKRFHPTTIQQTVYLPTPTNTRTLHDFDASSVTEGSATLSVRLDSPVSGKLLLLVDNTGGSRQPEVGQAPLIGRALMFTLSSSDVAECTVNTGESGLMQCPLEDYRVIEASIAGYLIKIPTVQTILGPTYDGMMKTARLEIRGNELEGTITLTFSGNGTTGDFVSAVTFTESVGILDGILFDANTPSNVNLKYDTKYTLVSAFQGNDPVLFLFGLSFTIVAEPARLVSASSKVNVGSNGTTLTLTSLSLPTGSEYSIVVVGTPTVPSGSNEEHSTTLKMTPTSATSNTLPVSLYPESKLKHGYTYSVEEMKLTGGSSSVLIEKLHCIFSTPTQPERLVSASCAFSFSDSQKSKLSLSFSSIALLAITQYTITFQSTAISSIPSHTKTVTVTTENDGTIASFDRCLYPIEEGSKRGEQLEFGLTYTVVSRDKILSIQLEGRALRTGEYTMSFVDSLGLTQNLSHSFELDSPLVFSRVIEGFTGSAIQFGSTYTISKVEVDGSEVVVNTNTQFTVPSPSVFSSAELTFLNSLSTSCVLTVTGSNFVPDEDFVVSLTPPCTIPIRFSTPTSGKTDVMGVGWIDSVEFDVEYRITSIESVSGLDVVVMTERFVLPALSRPFEVILNVDSSSSLLVAGVGWLIVRKGRHTRSSLRIIDSASLSSSLSVPKGSHVMVSNGTSVKSTFRVPSDAASVSGESLISVSSAFFDLLNLHVLIESTSPTFCLLLCVDSTIELDNIQLSVSQSTKVGNDETLECGWDHAAIELVNCSTEISNSKLTRLSQGAIQMSHGHLSIELCSFHDNSPNHTSFPSLRRNVICSDEGVVDVGSLEGCDGFEGSSGWFWLDDCSLTGSGLPQESALFVPTLSSNSTAVFDKKSKEFEILIVGATLIPCGLWLEVFEILKDGKEGNSTQIALTLECTSSFVETEVRMIVSESDLSSLSSKLEWKGRLVFGKNQTTDSFLIQASSSERISQAMKDNMKWWIPLVAGLAFALLLVIFIVIVCIRRRRILKTQREDSQVQELDDVNEKQELNVENEQQLVVAASTEHKSLSNASQPFSTMDAGFSDGTKNDKPEMELCLVCAEPFNTVFVEKKPTLFNILHEQRRPLVDRRMAEIQLSKGVEYVSKTFAGCSLLSTLTSHYVCVGSDGVMMLRMTNSSVDAVKEQPQPFGNSIVPFDPHNVYMPQPEHSIVPSIAPSISDLADESHLTRAPRSVDDGKRWQAPEEGKTDQQFDTRRVAVFRLGLVLFEMETGCVPFGENDAVNAHRNLEIGILPKMEVDPSQRPSLSSVVSTLSEMKESDAEEPKADPALF